MPDSSIVGTSGRSGERFELVTASARSFPALICGAEVLTWSNIIVTCPLMTSTIAWELPLYGTCSIFTPARRLKSSAAIWPVEPLPEEA